MKQEMTGWQWHQLDHMQIICTSLQTDNHASILSLKFFTSRMFFLTANQQQHCCLWKEPLLSQVKDTWVSEQDAEWLTERCTDVTSGTAARRPTCPAVQAQTTCDTTVAHPHITHPQLQQTSAVTEKPTPFSMLPAIACTLCKILFAFEL